MKPVRRFRLRRYLDPSGVSGPGVVASGVRLPFGWTFMRWRGRYPTLTLYRRTEWVIQIHGHGGLTTVEWVDSHRRVDA